ncbi:MAG: RHS repeat-associated core domain-containing protein, partial [Candidatus Pacearchaeota archaeon]
MGLLYYRFASDNHLKNILHILLIVSFLTSITGSPQRAEAQTPDPGTLVFYHTDHLGSTTAITDATGNVLQLLEYDPWGQVVKDIGDNYAHYRYTGQEFDPEIGLYNYRARMYAPGIGRFISPDPIVPEPGNPQSLNRYAYVMNNPLRYVDPSGNKWWESFLIGLAAGIVGGLVFVLSGGNPILAGMAAGFVAGAIQGGLATGTWQGALIGGIMGAAMGMFGGGIVQAAGVWGAIGLAAASLGAGYATGGWAGVGNVLLMMAGGFIGGIIGSALGNALMSIGTVDPGEAEFLGYEDELEVVELPNAVQWPVGSYENQAIVVTESYGARGGTHKSIDIRNPLGGPVQSTENGTVIEVGQTNNG